MNKTIKEMEKELNGKRYKVIAESINITKAKGGEVTHEDEIMLHYSWMETMNQVRKDFGLKPKEIR